MRLNLQYKILMVVMPLVVLPLVLLGWYAYETLEDNARKTLFRQMSTLLDQVEHGAQNHLSTVRSNIDLFSGSQLLVNYVLTKDETDRYSLLQPALMRLFSSYQRAYPDYYELRILLQGGYEDMRLTKAPLPNKTEYEHKSEYFRQLQAADDLLYEMYTYNEDNGEPVLYVGKRLLFRDESFEPLNLPPSLRGYLVITADLGYLRKQLDMHQLGNSGYLFITDAAGNVYTWPEEQEKGGHRSELDTQIRLSALHGEIVHASLQGTEVYLSGRKLHENLHLYAVLPAYDLHSSSRVLGIIVTLVTLMSIILVGVLVFILINWILIHPIRRLGSVAYEIGQGNFNIETNISSKDEIGELAYSFQEMSRNLKQSQEQVSYLAYRDALTGLPNRRMFQEYLHSALANAYRHKTGIAILFLDLDNFKQVNDTLGHQLGDKLLNEIARRIEECIRMEDQVSHTSPGTGIMLDDPSDTLARLGGDEFIILMSDFDEPSDIAHVAQRLLDIMSDPVEIDDNVLFVGCSIGISMYPTDGEDVDTLIKNADIAMYHAKENGRNNYQFYSESMNAVTMQRLILENDLRNAINNNELLLNYQPKVDISSGEIRSVEALIHWRHPDKGIIGPNTFIPVAESTGLILPIGEWVINEATRKAAGWHEQGINISVSVNISIVQLNKQNLLEIIRGSLIENECDAECLEIELTETSIMDAYEHASNTLNEIRSLGVKISMDDFGVGYSSFSYLRNLPIDILKIDRSFVRDITTDKKDAVIISAILAMAHTLNLKVVAEGVETPEQLELLRSHECDIAQGFLISRPLTEHQLLELIKSRKRFDFKNTQSADQEEPGSNSTIKFPAVRRKK